MIEVWGMTETGRITADSHEPRMIGTRAFGRPFPGLEARVVDDRDQDVPVGSDGELLVRHSAEKPRHGFFSGYLKNEQATEEAWRGGWFHTGDVVRQDASGMLFFVDRKKHIIRRAGENIAAAEIEAVLQAHDAVAQVAVVAAPDELREEEVLACVVPMPGVEAGRRAGRRAVRASATHGSPTSRRRAGCCSSTSCRPRARRRCRRPRSSRPAKTRASAPASSICGRASGGVLTDR